jgi:F-type H+-transporting ATPase subunit delta
MSGIKVGTKEIVDRYVTAIFQIAIQRDCLKVIVSDLKKLSVLVENNAILLDKLACPVIANQVKIKTITEISNKMKLSREILNLMVLLIKNHRFSFLENIISAFFEKYSEYQGIKKISILTADELDNNMQKNIVIELKKVFGDKLDPIFHIDEKIIGGLVVKIGSQVYDASVATKLSRLEKKSINEILNMQ